MRVSKQMQLEVAEDPFWNASSKEFLFALFFDKSSVDSDYSIGIGLTPVTCCRICTAATLLPQKLRINPDR